MRKIKAVKMGIEIDVEIYDNRAYLQSNYPLIMQAFKAALNKKGLKYEHRGKYVILTNEKADEQGTYDEMKSQLESAGFELL